MHDDWIIRLAEAKARLSDILERVEAGERITLTRRGTPIAMIVPAEAAEPHGDIDWKALDAFRATMPASTIPAVDAVRAMRDKVVQKARSTNVRLVADAKRAPSLLTCSEGWFAMHG